VLTPRLKHHVLIAFLSVGACVNLSACSGNREVHVETTRELDPAADRQRLRLTGAYVRVLLKSGDSISGQVRDVESDSITLERPRDYSFEERAVAIADIAKLEVVEEANSKQPRFSIASVIATTVVALALVAISQIRIQ
jgi:hypothetical protein